MLHLYALADHPVRLPPVQGIGGSALVAVEVEGIDAVLSSSPTTAHEATQEEILAHAAVVEKLASVNEAVLPARLSRPYENEIALSEAIRNRGPELRKALDRVRGCTEMGVRVIRESGSEHPDAVSGGEYMRGRLQEIRAAERVAEEIHDAVHAISRAETQQVLASPQLVLSAAYLLPRSEVDSLRTAVEKVGRTRPELTFICTGPWPPYSFALVDGSVGEQA